jgi:hypothetical protein
MIQRWNIADILQQLHRCSAELQHRNNDGFIQWGCKQDLYRVKFELDNMLNSAPTFSGEEEWLEEQRIEREQKQIWKALNDKTSN